MTLFKKKDNKKTEQEKVDERRAEVLAKGRKFKYPLQWTKYRVVANTILIAVVVVAIMIVSGWLALYRFGMTDEFLYRITKFVPAPVASVDGETVAFSDYLMFYRSGIISIERQSGQADDGNSLDGLRIQYKRSALDQAEDYTYALKLAKELELTVTDDEIAAEFDRHLNLGGVERSEESFLKIIRENFGLDKTEYERMLYLNLIKFKVESAIDLNASRVASRVESMLKDNGRDYAAVAEALGSDIIYEETGGMVPTQNIDGGRAATAFRLEPGKESGRFISINGDGYCFVKLIDKTETEVNFVSIKIPFTEFDTRMATLREDGAISEYITITGDE